MSSFQRGNQRAAKLNPLVVQEIRRKYALPRREWTQARLAREYQVSVGTIYNIVNHLTWQSVGLNYEPGEQAVAMAAALEPVRLDSEASMERLDKLLKEAQEIKNEELKGDRMLDELKGDSNEQS